MGAELTNFKPKKKQTWNWREIPDEPELAILMPGFECQYMITNNTVAENDGAIFGRAVFPPRSSHDKHQHLNAMEVAYTVKGKVVNGMTTAEGDEEYVCPEGQATFVRKGEVHWTRNPYDEPAEVVFAYYGCKSREDSGYVDLRENLDKKK